MSTINPKIKNDLSLERYRQIRTELTAFVNVLRRTGQLSERRIQARIERRAVDLMTAKERRSHIHKDRALELATDATYFAGCPEVYTGVRLSDEAVANILFINSLSKI